MSDEPGEYEDDELSQRLKDRWTAGKGSFPRPAGRDNAFTALIPDPPGSASRFRLEILSPEAR